MKRIAIKNLYDENGELIIKKNKEYLIYSTFYTNKIKMFVVLCEDDTLQGFNSDIFLTKAQYNAKNFNI